MFTFLPPSSLFQSLLMLESKVSVILIVVTGGRRRSVGVFMLKIGLPLVLWGGEKHHKRKWVNNKSSRRIGF